MDARKQKRLGAAPIASFEKSFEDTASTGNTIHSSTTSSMTSSSSATAATVMPAASCLGSTKFSALQEHEALAKDIHSNGELLVSRLPHATNKIDHIL